MTKMFMKLKGVMTQVSRSKYMPHYGKKETAKYAGRAREFKDLSPADERRHLVTIGGHLTLPGIELSTGQVLTVHLGTPSTPNDNPDMQAGLRIGQTVTWTSNAKAKTGEIVEVVPSGEVPKVKDASSPRDHISYVVQVGKVRYWPRVSLLNAVGV